MPLEQGAGRAELRQNFVLRHAASLILRRGSTELTSGFSCEVAHDLR